MDKEANFSSFFADIYCGAYINGLVTMKDGLSLVSPGGLTESIVDEIHRIHGTVEGAELEQAESSELDLFIRVAGENSFQLDDSKLIPIIEPIQEAMALCSSYDEINSEVAHAKQEREDYLNDFNFLQYLKSL